MSTTITATEVILAAYSYIESHPRSSHSKVLQNRLNRSNRFTGLPVADLDFIERYLTLLGEL